jgi:hypothetical protein
MMSPLSCGVFMASKIYVSCCLKRFYSLVLSFKGKEITFLLCHRFWLYFLSRYFGPILKKQMCELRLLYFYNNCREWIFLSNEIGLVIFGHLGLEKWAKHIKTYLENILRILLNQSMSFKYVKKKTKNPKSTRNPKSSRAHFFF